MVPHCKVGKEIFMIVHSYPLLLSMYKGENRILIIPLIDHVAGYSIDSDWFVNISDNESAISIGEGLIRAVEYIKSSPLSSLTPKERDESAAWRKNTKYKSKVTFWKNNHYVRVKITEDSQYIVHSMKKSEKRQGTYDEVVKETIIPSTATAEELGKAVIDVFQAVEEYEQGQPVYDLYPTKSIELLDNSTLTIKPPRDGHFEDGEDGGATEIYQCYCYLPQEGAESSAEFFLSIASELDCSLEFAHVKKVWEELNGKSEFFEIQESEFGIFKVRAEMQNKGIHKISYFLQQDEDLLLECSMEVHQPNRKKKLDEKLVKLFDEFVLSCNIQ